jgi:ATP-dependent Lhr-like helicase
MNGFRALLAQQGVGGGQRGVGRSSFTQEPATEGRWRCLSEVDDDVTSDRDKSDTRMAAWAALLMQRYGVVCREVVHFAAPGLAWADLADWLESAEWRGEVRRGYFVEGLSGVQYTTDDTANELVMFCDRIAAGAEQTGLDPSIHLVSAIDPANVYGSSAPLDLPLVDGGRARLPRILGNSLVLVDGRPVWIVQERGKRLTSLPHASEAVREQALRHLIRNFTGTSTKWTVSVLDDAPPVTTKWAEVLGQLGFVHDGLSMTMYRGLI